MKDTMTLEKISTVLAQKGYSEEQIARVMEEVAKAGFQTLYAQAVEVFDEHDLEAIANCPEDKVAHVVARRFEEKTGKSAQSVMDEFIEAFAATLLAQIEAEK